MAAQEIGAFEAKSRLSELLEQVARGRTFVITRRGRPVAELRPVESPAARLTFGCDRGQVIVGGDFDAPRPDFESYSK